METEPVDPVYFKREKKKNNYLNNLDDWWYHLLKWWRLAWGSSIRWKSRLRFGHDVVMLHVQHQNGDARDTAELDLQPKL